MNILLTGGAGFIGSALVRRLIIEGHKVVVVDNFNEYYDSSLKRARAEEFLNEVEVIEVDITKREELEPVFQSHKFDLVCHLAAQAGVRYSVEAPDVYVMTNVLGTQLIYELMQEHKVSRMVMASSSSVYGINTPVPFREDSAACEPVSIYAATKRAGELIGHNYFKQYQIETTALRFFTVYGPWSRPDMAMLKFADKITAGETIDVYNEGNMRRDFTYIDDIVDGFVAAVETPLGFEIVNLGNGSPVKLTDFIELLEAELGIEAEKNFLPMQQGDVFETYADITKAKELLNYSPTTDFSTGVKNFIAWFKTYKQN